MLYFKYRSKNSGMNSLFSSFSAIYHLAVCTFCSVFYCKLLNLFRDRNLRTLCSPNSAVSSVTKKVHQFMYREYMPSIWQVIFLNFLLVCKCYLLPLSDKDCVFNVAVLDAIFCHAQNTHTSWVQSFLMLKISTISFIGVMIKLFHISSVDSNVLICWFHIIVK